MIRNGLELDPNKTLQLISALWTILAIPGVGQVTNDARALAYNPQAKEERGGGG